MRYIYFQVLISTKISTLNMFSISMTLYALLLLCLVSFYIFHNLFIAGTVPENIPWAGVKNQAFGRFRALANPFSTLPNILHDVHKKVGLPALSPDHCWLVAMGC